MVRTRGRRGPARALTNEATTKKAPKTRGKAPKTGPDSALARPVAAFRRRAANLSPRPRAARRADGLRDGARGRRRRLRARPPSPARWRSPSPERHAARIRRRRRSSNLAPVHPSPSRSPGVNRCACGAFAGPDSALARPVAAFRAVALPTCQPPSRGPSGGVPRAVRLDRLRVRSAPASTSTAPTASSGARDGACGRRSGTARGPPSPASSASTVPGAVARSPSPASVASTFPGAVALARSGTARGTDSAAAALVEPRARASVAVPVAPGVNRCACGAFAGPDSARPAAFFASFASTVSASDPRRWASGGTASASTASTG